MFAHVQINLHVLDQRLIVHLVTNGWYIWTPCGDIASHFTTVLQNLPTQDLPDDAMSITLYLSTGHVGKKLELCVWWRR